MWKVVVYRFNNASQAIGSQTQVADTKAEALAILQGLGVNTQVAKSPGNKNLISRIGHTYNVGVSK